jgi:hypothetical protein
MSHLVSIVDFTRTAFDAQRLKMFWDADLPMAACKGRPGREK